MDGWPASTPQQSNFRFTNGISQCRAPNGFQRYFKHVYLYNGILYKPRTKFVYDSGTMTFKGNNTYFTQNDIQYAFVENLQGSELRLCNILRKCGEIK
tara:strand:+ start:197 stop:490 length:294 start_codon:yes stop_codon:yes gene_type:complete